MKKICIKATKIKTNQVRKMNEPVIMIIDENSNIELAREIKINGPSSVVYNPTCPLPEGAVVWIETESEVIIIR